MRKPGARALTWAWAGMLAFVTMVACGHQDSAARAPSGGASPGSSDSPNSGVYAFPLQQSDLPWSGSPSPYNAQVELDDGRRWPWHYRRGKGLVEQHYSPRAKAWTKPTVIRRTRTDACQGIELRTSAGTVAAIADFGAYCYDGEPRPSPSRPSAPAA